MNSLGVMLEFSIKTHISKERAWGSSGSHSGTAQGTGVEPAPKPRGSQTPRLPNRLPNLTLPGVVTRCQRRAVISDIFCGEGAGFSEQSWGVSDVCEDSHRPEKMMALTWIWKEILKTKESQQ